MPRALRFLVVSGYGEKLLSRELLVPLLADGLLVSFKLELLVCLML